jgi:hypothetical protein
MDTEALQGSPVLVLIARLQKISKPAKEKRPPAVFPM